MAVRATARWTDAADGADTVEKQQRLDDMGGALEKMEVGMSEILKFINQPVADLLLVRFTLVKHSG